MRDSYIRMRNSGNLDINWFFKYFRQEGGNADPGLFYEVFEYERIDKIEVPGGYMENKIPRNKEQLVQNMDRKFGLTILYDQNGNFLKAVN
jgi:hypothetical protein